MSNLSRRDDAPRCCRKLLGPRWRDGGGNRGEFIPENAAAAVGSGTYPPEPITALGEDLTQIARTNSFWLQLFGSISPKNGPWSMLFALNIFFYSQEDAVGGPWHTLEEFVIRGTGSLIGNPHHHVELIAGG